MAKIITEKGKCNEYTFFGHNAGLYLILLLTGFYRSNIFREPKDDPVEFSEHTLRVYQDSIEICKNSFFRKKFTEYKKDDIESITKSFRIYLIPIIMALLLIAFVIVVKVSEFLLFVPIFIPFSFGRCLKIKVKGRMLPIKLSYSPSRYDTMIDKIMLTWKAKI